MNTQYELLIKKNSRDPPLNTEENSRPMVSKNKRYHPTAEQIAAANVTQRKYGLVLAGLVVALLALPAPLRMVSNIDLNITPQEIEHKIFVPVEPTLEQKLESIPIHPMNVDPKMIFNDQFVDRVEVIEERAIAINSTFKNDGPLSF